MEIIGCFTYIIISLNAYFYHHFTFDLKFKYKLG